MLSLEEQQVHIAAFKERHAIEETARFEDLDTEADDGLGQAIDRARADGVFILMDHLDDLARVIAVLNAAGINFVSAQSSDQALYSFFNP